MELIVSFIGGLLGGLNEMFSIDCLPLLLMWAGSLAMKALAVREGSVLLIIATPRPRASSLGHPPSRGESLGRLGRELRRHRVADWTGELLTMTISWLCLGSSPWSLWSYKSVTGSNASCGLGPWPKRSTTWGSTKNTQRPCFNSGSAWWKFCRRVCPSPPKTQESGSLTAWCPKCPTVPLEQQ